MESQKVWFVTGASKGLGLILVKKLLQAGEKVAATSRKSGDLINAVGVQSENFLPLEMDLVNEQSVKNAIDKTMATFNRIDVVVNNAGFGQFGTLEELTAQESRNNFDVNVFGLLHVIRNSMPHLRRQKSGHIFNISSIGGFSAEFAGWGIYCATKFAVAALTESLDAEVKEFGIKATCVYPGYFRTSFLDAGSMQLPANTIADYQSARNSQSLHENDLNGKQMGDPEKAISVIIDTANNENPVLHLFLGQDAYELANTKISSVVKDMKETEKQSTATNFDV